MHKLYVLCGVPGAGKSTWAKEHLMGKGVYISRDSIRYSMLSDTDIYFAKEDRVFDEFVQSIAAALAFNNVIADATHITRASRQKLLSGIRKYFKNDFTVCYLCFPRTLEVCKAHNALRAGREYVPETAIERMYKQLQWPEYTEDAAITSIWMIKGDIYEQDLADI